MPDQAKSFESDRMSIHGGPENRACVRFSTLFFRSMAFPRRRIPAVPIKMLAGRMTVRFGRPSTASAQEWAGVAKKAVDATRLLRRSSSLLFLFVRGVQRLQKYQFFRVAIKPRGTILGTKKTGPKIERKPGFKGMSERHRLGIIQLAVVRPRFAPEVLLWEMSSRRCHVTVLISSKPVSGQSASLRRPSQLRESCGFS